jgi:hypothetical protein
MRLDPDDLHDPLLVPRPLDTALERLPLDLVEETHAATLLAATGG